jgi:antitoxin component HigA of HigAB toxin-antitoxin module
VPKALPGDGAVFSTAAMPAHESLKVLMQDRGLAHQDVWPVLGNKRATTEILAGRRSISKAQAKRLAAFFRVPVDLFL